MRSRSVVPPIPNEVSEDRAVPGFSWTPSAANSRRILVSLRRMTLRGMRGQLVGTQQNHQLVAGTADAAGSDGQNRITRAGISEQEANAVLHGANVLDMFVAGLTNRGGQGFAGYAGNRRLAGRVDVGYDQKIGLIEGSRELRPEMLGAAVTVRLKQNQQAVELAA